jgi:hypothetical protein
MRRLTCAVLIVVAVAAQSVARAQTQSPTAQAQSWEVSGFIGHTPSADLDRRSSDLEELAIRGGFTWGAQAARLFGPNWAAEVMRTEHSSALQIGTRHRAVLIFFHGRAARHGPALRA